MVVKRMSKLEKLIAELCPNGVEFKHLEDCCNILNKKRKPVTKAARENGEYPYYGANGIQDYVSEYIFDGTFILVGEDGSVVTPSGTPVVNWAVGKIWVNNHAHVVEEVEGVYLRYLYHYIQTIDVRDLIHGNIPKLNQSDFRKLKIAVPPLEVQRAIVRVLDSFTLLTTELIAKLTAEHTVRKKQYDFYRDILLKRNDKVSVKTIDELCNVSAGGDAPREAMSKEKTIKYCIPIISNGIGENALYGYTNEAKITEPAVTVAARGTIGYAEYRDYPYVPIIRLLSLIPKNTNELDAKYLYYCLQGKTYNVSTAGIPQLTAPMVKQVQIPIPELTIQKKIVRVLDEFEAICNDLSNGLPAEIEARKKQYEYYRDKLLSF